MTPRAARVRPEFWEDLLAAIDFYNAARPGLGEEFAEDVRANVRRVAENPESYPVIRRPFRRVLLRRFGRKISSTPLIPITFTFWALSMVRATLRAG